MWLASSQRGSYYSEIPPCGFAFGGAGMLIAVGDFFGLGEFRCPRFSDGVLV